MKEIYVSETCGSLSVFIDILVTSIPCALRLMSQRQRDLVETNLKEVGVIQRVIDQPTPTLTPEDAPNSAIFRQQLSCY